MTSGKNLRSLALFSIGLAALLFPACAGTYYAPTPMPTLFSKRNDLAAGASLGHQGAGGNLAWSPLKYLYAAASGQTQFDGSHSVWEVGGGAYLYAADGLFFDIGGGTGRGRFTYNDPMSGSGDSFITARGNYRKSFASMNLGFKSRNSRLGFGGRINWLEQHYDANFSGNNFYQKWLAGRTFEPRVFEYYFFQEHRIAPQLYLFNIIGAVDSPQKQNEIQLFPLFFRVGLNVRLNLSQNS